VRAAVIVPVDQPVVASTSSTVLVVAACQPTIRWAKQSAMNATSTTGPGPAVAEVHHPLGVRDRRGEVTVEPVTRAVQFLAGIVVR
jgi:hypothetical protein